MKKIYGFSLDKKRKFSEPATPLFRTISIGKDLSKDFNGLSLSISVFLEVFPSPSKALSLYPLNAIIFMQRRLIWGSEWIHVRISNQSSAFERMNLTKGSRDTLEFQSRIRKNNSKLRILDYKITGVSNHSKQHYRRGWNDIVIFERFLRWPV